MISDKRLPNNEPTLMIGDVAMDFDFTFVDNFIQTTSPYPMKLRKSQTKNEMKINSFYQYSSFDDARIALKKLNGARVPGMSLEFQLDMNFTKQHDETCAHLSISDLHLTRFEVMKLLSRYKSVLGLAQYQFQLWNGMIPKTKCFIRFGEMEECMQAVRELNGFPVEGNPIHMTLSTRYIDTLKEYVIKREAQKSLSGIPKFHNVYGKQKVSTDKFNEMIIATSADLFDELEGSRWSPAVFNTNVYYKDYNRQITLNFFENF